VMDIQVAQGEGGKGTEGEKNVGCTRTSVVGVTFGAVGVNYRKASGRGVKETIRGEKVECHDVPPSKKRW